jgi:choline dehydrogenase-like flavoprotein
MRPALVEAIRQTAIDGLERPGAFDAVVVGAGAAGGLAAERLTQGGLRVLLLDAGFRPGWLAAPYRRLTAAMVGRLADPSVLPWLPASLLYKGRRAMRVLGRLRQPVQIACYAWERRPDAFVDDRDCPYSTAPGRPFLWLRARALQGRVGIPGHGRLYFRLGPDDFAASWPIAAGELDRWYADVERRLGMAGGRDGLPWLPDSAIAHPLEPTPAEAELMARITARWPAAHPVLGRSAPPPDTLETAAATGRLSLRQGAIVRAIDVAHGRATGVRWFDQASGRDCLATVPLIFLCASALESTRILLLSRDAATGRGLGAGSDALGHYLMDHMVVHASGVGGPLPGPPAAPAEDGRCLYLPRFDARDGPLPPSGRGFGVQVYRSPIAGGRAFFTAVAFAEMAPRRENRVMLHPRRVDRWGVPILHIDCAISDQDRRRAADQTSALRMLAEIAGVSLRQLDTVPQPPGGALHECGTARMGRDPATSVLDPHNQCWDAAGLYVTDSAAFPSQGSQNPTLTIMALTARACAHALGPADGDRLPGGAMAPYEPATLG